MVMEESCRRRFSADSTDGQASPTDADAPGLITLDEIRCDSPETPPNVDSANIHENQNAKDAQTPTDQHIVKPVDDSAGDVLVSAGQIGESLKAHDESVDSSLVDNICAAATSVGRVQDTLGSVAMNNGHGKDVTAIGTNKKIDLAIAELPSAKMQHDTENVQVDISVEGSVEAVFKIGEGSSEKSSVIATPGFSLLINEKTLQTKINDSELHNADHKQTDFSIVHEEHIESSQVSNMLQKYKDISHQLRVTSRQVSSKSLTSPDRGARKTTHKGNRSVTTQSKPGDQNITSIPRATPVHRAVDKSNRTAAESSSVTKANVDVRIIREKMVPSANEMEEGEIMGANEKEEGEITSEEDCVILVRENRKPVRKKSAAAISVERQLTRREVLRRYSSDTKDRSRRSTSPRRSQRRNSSPSRSSKESDRDFLRLLKEAELAHRKSKLRKIARAPTPLRKTRRTRSKATVAKMSLKKSSSFPSSVAQQENSTLTELERLRIAALKSKIAKAKQATDAKATLAVSDKTGDSARNVARDAATTNIFDSSTLTAEDILDKVTELPTAASNPPASDVSTQLRRKLLWGMMQSRMAKRKLNSKQAETGAGVNSGSNVPQTEVKDVALEQRTESIESGSLADVPMELDNELSDQSSIIEVVFGDSEIREVERDNSSCGAVQKNNSGIGAALSLVAIADLKTQAARDRQVDQILSAQRQVIEVNPFLCPRNPFAQPVSTAYYPHTVIPSVAPSWQGQAAVPVPAGASGVAHVALAKIRKSKLTKSQKRQKQHQQILLNIRKLGTPAEKVLHNIQCNKILVSSMTIVQLTNEHCHTTNTVVQLNQVLRSMNQGQVRIKKRNRILILEAYKTRIFTLIKASTVITPAGNPTITKLLPAIPVTTETSSTSLVNPSITSPVIACDRPVVSDRSNLGAASDAPLVSQKRRRRSSRIAAASDVPERKGSVAGISSILNLSDPEEQYNMFMSRIGGQHNKLSVTFPTVTMAPSRAMAPFPVVTSSGLQVPPATPSPTAEVERETTNSLRLQALRSLTSAGSKKVEKLPFEGENSKPTRAAISESWDPAVSIVTSATSFPPRVPPALRAEPRNLSPSGGHRRVVAERLVNSPDPYQPGTPPRRIIKSPRMPPIIINLGDDSSDEDDGVTVDDLVIVPTTSSHSRKLQGVSSVPAGLDDFLREMREKTTTKPPKPPMPLLLSPTTNETINLLPPEKKLEYMKMKEKLLQRRREQLVKRSKQAKVGKVPEASSTTSAGARTQSPAVSDHAAASSLSKVQSAPQLTALTRASAAPNTESLPSAQLYGAKTSTVTASVQQTSPAKSRVFGNNSSTISNLVKARTVITSASKLQTNHSSTIKPRTNDTSMAPSISRPDGSRAVTGNAVVAVANTDKISRASKVTSSSSYGNVPLRRPLLSAEAEAIVQRRSVILRKVFEYERIVRVRKTKIQQLKSEVANESKLLRISQSELVELRHQEKIIGAQLTSKLKLASATPRVSSRLPTSTCSNVAKIPMPASVPSVKSSTNTNKPIKTLPKQESSDIKINVSKRDDVELKQETLPTDVDLKPPARLFAEPPVSVSVMTASPSMGLASASQTYDPVGSGTSTTWSYNPTPISSKSRVVETQGYDPLALGTAVSQAYTPTPISSMPVPKPPPYEPVEIYRSNGKDGKGTLSATAYQPMPLVAIVGEKPLLKMAAVVNETIDEGRRRMKALERAMNIKLRSRYNKKKQLTASAKSGDVILLPKLSSSEAAQEPPAKRRRSLLDLPDNPEPEVSLSTERVTAVNGSSHGQVLPVDWAVRAKLVEESGNVYPLLESCRREEGVTDIYSDLLTLHTTQHVKPSSDRLFTVAHSLRTIREQSSAARTTDDINSAEQSAPHSFSCRYSSVLKAFHMYRLNPYLRVAENYTAQSRTFCHNFDPRIPLCKYDLHGACNDPTCEHQHERSYTLDMKGNIMKLRSLSSHKFPDTAEEFIKRCRSCRNLSNEDILIEAHDEILHAMGNNLPHTIEFTSSKFSMEVTGLADVAADTLKPSKYGAARDLTKPPTGSQVLADDVIFGSDVRYYMDNSSTAEEMERAVQDTPTDVTMWLKLAHKKLYDGRHSTEAVREALHILSLALESNSEDLDLWLAYLRLYGKQRESDKTDYMEICEKALEKQTCYEIFLLYISTLSSTKMILEAGAQIPQFILIEEAMSDELKSFNTLQSLLFCADVAIKAGHPLVGSSKLKVCLVTDTVEYELLTKEDRLLAGYYLAYLKVYKCLPQGLLHEGKLTSRQPLSVNWTGASLTPFERAEVTSLLTSVLRVCAEGTVVDSPSHWAIRRVLLDLSFAMEASSMSRMWFVERNNREYPDFYLLYLRHQRHTDRSHFRKLCTNCTHSLPYCARIYFYLSLWSYADNLSLAEVNEFPVRLIHKLFGFDIGDEVSYETIRHSDYLYRVLLDFDAPDNVKLPPTIANDKISMYNDNLVYIWLSYGYYLEVSEADPDAVIDMYETAMSRLVDGRHVQLICWRYLVYRSKLAVLPATSPGTSALKTYLDVVSRCLGATPTRHISPQNKFYPDFTFHNKVLTYVAGLLHPSDVTGWYEKWMVKYPDNTQLIPRLSELYLQRPGSDYISIRHICKVLGDRSIPNESLWILYISATINLKRFREALSLARRSVRLLPHSLALWKKYVSLMLSVSSLYTDVRNAIAECKETDVNIEHLQSLPAELRPDDI